MIRELIKRLKGLARVEDEVVMDDQEFESLFLQEEDESARGGGGGGGGCLG
jgi:hypothetical protein